MKRLIGLAAAAAIVAGGFVYLKSAAGGFSARAKPTAAERVVARLVRHFAIPADARAMRNPVPVSDEALAEARAHFADHCAICHDNDGSGQTMIGQGLYPKPPDLRARETQQLSDGELYWIIENGVRLTGMPAFGTGTPDDLDTWKLVHLIRRLDQLTPAQLEEMEALNPKSPAEIEEEREDEQFLKGNDRQ